MNGVSKVDKNKTYPQIEPKNDKNKSSKTNEVPKNNEKNMKEETKNV